MSFDRRALRRLWKYLAPYWRLELLTLLVMVLIAGLTLALPLAVEYMIDRLIPGLRAQTGALDLGPVIRFGLFLAAIYLFNVIFAWARDYLAARIGAGIVRDIRAELFYHLERVSLRVHQRGSVGEFMSRVNGWNDLYGISLHTVLLGRGERAFLENLATLNYGIFVNCEQDRR